MGHSTRRLRIDDHAALRALRLRALAGEPSAFGSTLDREEAFPEEIWKDRLRPDAHPSFGGFDEAGALVGLAVGIPDAADASVAHLVGMWVDPMARGGGLAAELVGLVIDWAAGRSCRVVRLHVTDGNTRAEALYARLGFVRAGHATVRERDGLAEIEMALTIGPWDEPLIR